MRQAVKNFTEQFSFTPEILNFNNSYNADKFVVCGMGGSHLSADIIKAIDFPLPVQVHSNYDLPTKFIDPDVLYIANSYSGNTIETLSFAQEVIKNGGYLAIITTGGNLLTLAEKYQIPHIILPTTAYQPRIQLVHQLLALANFIEPDLIPLIQKSAHRLDTKKSSPLMKKVALKLKNSIPVFYSSQKNQSLAYIFKIMCNETSKIPAFYNVFPEMNHNELQGYDGGNHTKHVVKNLTPLFITDSEDDERIIKRSQVTSELLSKNNISSIKYKIHGKGRLKRIWNTIIDATWLSLHLGEAQSVETGPVPLIEEFKTKL